MIQMDKNNKITRVHLSGDINRSNILPIRDDILEGITPGTKHVEFHFEDIYKMDAPSMAMIVIVVKRLLAKKIASSITGLTGENMYLARVLGLHLLADLDGRTQGER